VRVDEIDRKILRILQDDASVQNQDLAARVGLSASPCLRRVKALEAAGVIRRYVALLDGKAVGAGFVAFVEVRLEKQTEAYSTRFEAVVLGRSEVIDCSFVTGDFDYLLKVAVADLDEFHRFLTQVITRIDGVANTRTIIPVKRIKETTAVKMIA
jgi:DNA-binding Lrp family transcriptional regulator